MLLELQDGEIVEIETDSDFSPGCGTCDYGSSYISEVTITMKTGRIYIETSQMYEYALSDGDLLTIILPNVEHIRTLTEKEFFEWLKGQLKARMALALKVCEFRQ